MKTWFDHLGIFSLAIYPPVGLGLFFLKTLFERTWQQDLRQIRPWFHLWIALLFPVPFQFFASHDSRWLIFGFILALVASWVLVSRVRIWKGLAAALMVILATGMITRETSKDLWINPTQPLELPNTLSGISTLSNSSNLYHSFGKIWSLAPGNHSLRLSFEARSNEGTFGWDWYRYHPEFQLEPFHDEAGQLATKVIPPVMLGKSHYITRELDTGQTLAGRTFRATVELRSPDAISTSECDGIILQENGGRYGGQCLPISLNNLWQTFQVVWTAHESILTSHLRLVLINLGTPYDVKGARLEERIDNTWIELGPLEPTGVTVRPFIAEMRRQELPSFAFVPKAAWEKYSYNFDVQTLSEDIRFLLQLEGNTSLEIRHILLEDSKTNTKVPGIPFSRQSLWFPQANLAGHSATMLGLTLLNSLSSGWLGLLSSGLTFASIYLTGSRAAWLAALLGIPWLLWLIARQERRWIVVILLIGVTLLIIPLRTVGLVSSRVLDLEDGNTVTRTQIWRVSWEGFLEHPWTGLGGNHQDFLTYWENHPNAPQQTADHAHNFWLHFAVSFGIPGLLASLWITVGLLYLAWRWGQWRGLAVVLPVFLMNIFDYTLFYSSVLFLLIFAMNTLRYRTSSRMRPYD